MAPPTIGGSFDGGEHVVPGSIPGFVASLMHESGFQSAEATFHRGIAAAISLPAHGWNHPQRRRGPCDNRRRMGCRDRNGGSGRALPLDGHG